jgi:hypothetical protein
MRRALAAVGLVLCAQAADAQPVTLTINSGGTSTFPNPTVTDFANLFVDNPTPIAFTVAVGNITGPPPHSVTPRWRSVPSTPRWWRQGIERSQMAPRQFVEAVRVHAPELRGAHQRQSRGIQPANAEEYQRDRKCHPRNGTQLGDRHADELRHADHAPTHRRQSVIARGYGRRVVAAAVLCMPFVPAHAQRGRLEGSGPAPLSRTGQPAARDDEHDTDPVVADGAPRTFRIITIPIPAELLNGSSPIDYTVVSAGTLRILGTRQGRIDPAVGRRDIMFTIAIPSVAIARRMAVGYVTFSVAGGETVRVPVSLDVAAVRRIGVEAKRGVVGGPARRARHVAIHHREPRQWRRHPFHVGGRPAGWPQKSTAPAALVVAAGAHVEHDVVLAIPSDVGTGSWFVDLAVSRGATEVARAEATLEVSPSVALPVRSGPTMTAGAIGVFAGGHFGRIVETVALDGALTDAVRVAGRYTSPVPADAITDRATARLGYTSRSNSLAVRADDWGVGVGMTGLAAGELAGAGIFGRGASVAVRPGDFSVQATAVTPASGSSTDTAERNIAARGDWHTEYATLSVNASHLRDAEFGSRQLDAFTLGAAGPVGPASYTLEAGPRRYAGGSGFGTLAEVRASGSNGDFTVRAIRAPGGSGAFAASRSGMFVSGGRQVGARYDLSGSAWRTSDENVTFSNLSSGGWAFTPRVDLSRTLSIGADIHASSYQSRAVDNMFGTSTMSYAARGGYATHGLQARTTVAWSRMRRDAEALGTSFRTPPIAPRSRIRSTWSHRAGGSASAPVWSATLPTSRIFPSGQRRSAYRAARAVSQQAQSARERVAPAIQLVRRAGTRHGARRLRACPPRWHAPVGRHRSHRLGWRGCPWRHRHLDAVRAHHGAPVHQWSHRSRSGVSGLEWQWSPRSGRGGFRRCHSAQEFRVSGERRRRKIQTPARARRSHRVGRSHSARWVDHEPSRRGRFSQ